MLATLPNRVSALFADPFQTVFRTFDRDLPWNGEANGSSCRKFAPVSMWSDGNQLFLEIDVPGVAIDDLDVSVEDGKLTIRGVRKASERPTESAHEERFFGQFERTVVLGEWVDPNSVEATLRDGVLALKLSRKPEAQRQKVTINYVKDGADAQRIEATPSPATPA